MKEILVWALSILITQYVWAIVSIKLNEFDTKREAKIAFTPYLPIVVGVNKRILSIINDYLRLGDD